MTAIVAVPCTRRKRLVFGGDAAVSTKGFVYLTASPKVWRAGGYLVGAAGDGAWFSLLYSVDWPKVASSGYVRTGLVRDIQQALKQGDFEEPDGTALLGAVIDGIPRIWMFDSDLAWDEIPEGSHGAVCGSGGQCAAGALFAAKGTPERRAKIALEAATAFRADVRPPFTILRY